jgi:hypothetical protein
MPGTVVPHYFTLSGNLPSKISSNCKIHRAGKFYWTSRDIACSWKVSEQIKIMLYKT